MRSFALRARGFCSVSSRLGVMALFGFGFSFAVFPHTQTGKSGGHVHPFDSSLIALFTILSSSE
jgi:hypothetical protein